MSTISMHLPVDHRDTTTPEVASATPAEQKPFTMADAQLRTIPVSALVVFVTFALISYFIEGEVGRAVGVGAFMAFWIGGGFGAIVGGALWNHHNEASLYKD